MKLTNPASLTRSSWHRGPMFGMGRDRGMLTLSSGMGPAAFEARQLWPR